MSAWSWVRADRGKRRRQPAELFRNLHLFDYGFKNFAYRTILEDKEIIQEVPVSLSKTDYVTVHPPTMWSPCFPVIWTRRAGSGHLPAGDRRGPCHRRNKLGTMELRDGDTVYASVDLLCQQ